MSFSYTSASTQTVERSATSKSVIFGFHGRALDDLLLDHVAGLRRADHQPRRVAAGGHDGVDLLGTYAVQQQLLPRAGGQTADALALRGQDQLLRRAVEFGAVDFGQRIALVDDR